MNLEDRPNLVGVKNNTWREKSLFFKRTDKSINDHPERLSAFEEMYIRDILDLLRHDAAAVLNEIADPDDETRGAITEFIAEWPNIRAALQYSSEIVISDVTKQPEIRLTLSQEFEEHAHLTAA